MISETIKRINKILFYDSQYGIAYKRKDEEIFHALLPTRRFQYADPFIIEQDGIVAIFVELMDFRYGWGTIGVIEIEDGKKPIVKEIIKEPNHMSFPNVFSHDDILYMMPETYGAEDVHLYKCIDFPFRWEKVCSLIENVHLVDHSVWEIENETFVISYDLDSELARTFVVDWDNARMIETFPQGHFCRERPGGSFYLEEGRIKRVVQDCTQVYGDFIKIYEINHISKEIFDEELKETRKLLIIILI